MSPVIRKLFDFWRQRHGEQGWGDSNFLLFALYAVRKLSPRLDLYDEVVDLMLRGWRPEDEP